MTIAYTVYDTTTGEILRTGTTITMAQALLQGNTAGTKVVTVGSDPVTQRIDVANPNNPVVTNRPSSGISASKTSFTANGSDSVTLSGIGNSSTYSVIVPADQGIDPIPNGTITDGSLVITTTVAGAYTVKISKYPNADYLVTLNAT